MIKVYGKNLETILRQKSGDFKHCERRLGYSRHVKKGEIPTVGHTHLPAKI